MTINSIKAWTALNADFDQRLVVDLGQVMNITRIATQGRPLSQEYVQEYTISYGTNGQDYADYKDSDGNIKQSLILTIKLINLGDFSWSPKDNTYYHFLTIDLGARVKIRAIATQGQSNTKECVTEYILQYSDNGQLWRSYSGNTGEAEMFNGNIDGSTIHRNEFEIPIIAQWVRINPTRWNERISLRVELYGCDYESNLLYMNGSSLLVWHLNKEPVYASRESIRFRFKTSQANGVLLYSRGTQGDYIALQLHYNRLLLNLDLGSRIMTSLSVGSLLDDNLWHDVVISRNRRDIVFSVDRVVTQGRIKGEFARLNLNREFYIGGVPNKQEGLSVTQNFTGCIENFYVNSTNVIKEVKTVQAYGYDYMQKINTLEICPEPPIIPVTFLTSTSFVKLKGYEGVRSLNASFAFRTYEENGVLLFHKFTSPGDIKLYLENGYIKVDVQTGTNPRTILNNFHEPFNDGRWHQVVLTVGTNKLILEIDGVAMTTNRLLSMSTGPYYMIGGGIHGQEGFIGCMRMISVDGNYKLPTDWTKEDYCCGEEILFDSCHMIDRCNPNPCKHNGFCKQNSKEFFCDCTGTEYAGSVCHTSTNPLSCEAYKNVNDVGSSAEIKIDVDGSGPLKPFPVTCQFFADGKVETIIHHSNEETTPVNGFQEPGSFIQDITYDADLEQIEAFMNRSTSCKQRLHYSCKNSRLLNSPSRENNFQPFAWWVSRWNQKMDYWGGALPGSRKCECGILGQCVNPTNWCNCDAALDVWAEDGGDITQMEHLPVKQVRFGDTGNPLDEKQGQYTLGPLICAGDNLFNNVVTFRVADASINLPTFDIGHSGDIYFEFKTTAKDAVLLHSTGPTDYIKLSITTGNRIQFEYQAGSGTLGVSVDTAYRLDDNNWHSISIERNRKGGRLVVDGSSKNEVHETTGPIRALHLTSDLVIGSSVDYRDGFVGCIRALLLNGKLADLRGIAEKGLYGISVGCVGKCISNPCLNNGTCIEGYDGYTCDCRWTAFKGPICADEIGAVMRPDTMIKYDFMGSWRSTIAENIRVGFTTTNPKGFLLGFSSNISGEYLTIMISNSGHLRVVFDFGFERQELIFPNKHFGLGQYHDVRIRRKNSGATLVMEVDSYEPKEFHFNIKASADAQFNNIQYMYIGRNESMSEGFTGCISRVEFDDIYPLKLLFQENGPRNVKVANPTTEDFCGVEPVTHPPDIFETRPPPILDEDRVKAAYNQTDSAVIGGVLAVLFVALVLFAVFAGRYVARHKGEYITQEDKGAEVALDPDSAVVRSRTGHQVTEKKEWFI
ncbi:Contactin-associated protein 1 precursor, putative [Pediculus humanus corporis]|uniref:Contactin-associated protein 1, putative n=1 Tax=Pediculus humanus subsp. corporis TaxID=121224 RepID=E0VKA9_PEDHC|nr:Contactin-associated protein 1 precursor, putative [Pediculus humanus corporis]EEB13815.1 Contactin-associated protein 1 precursor, putative [Pediculus humanus corporis]